MASKYKNMGKNTASKLNVQYMLLADRYCLRKIGLVPLKCGLVCGFLML